MSQPVPPLLPAGPPLISAGSLRFDPETAPAVIKDLEEARRELLEILDGAVRLGNVNPGSRDSVSVDFARRLEEVAVGGDGSLVSAVRAAIAEVDGLIMGMKLEGAAYELGESGNAASFRA